MGFMFLILIFVLLGNVFFEYFKYVFEYIVSCLFQIVDIKYMFYIDNNVYFKFLMFDV